MPRLRSARSAARRCLRGRPRPGRSSDEGGSDELPLLRDAARSSRATRSCNAAISLACSAITPSRAAHAAQSGPGRQQIGHNRRSSEPALSSQVATLGRLSEDHHAFRQSPAVTNRPCQRHRVNVYVDKPPLNRNPAGTEPAPSGYPLTAPPPRPAMSRTHRCGAVSSRNASPSPARARDSRPAVTILRAFPSAPRLPPPGIYAGHGAN